MSVKRKRATLDRVYDTIRFQDNLKRCQPWSKIQMLMKDSADIDNAEEACGMPVLTLCVLWIDKQTQNGTIDVAFPDKANYIQLINFCVATGMTMQAYLNAPARPSFIFCAFTRDILKASTLVNQPISLTSFNDENLDFLLDIASIDQCKQMAPLTSGQFDAFMFEYKKCTKSWLRAKKFAHILKDDVDCYYLAICLETSCKDRDADWYKLLFCNDIWHNYFIAKHIENKRLEVQEEITEFFVSDGIIILAIANIICSFFQQPTLHICRPQKNDITTASEI